MQLITSQHVYLHYYINNFIHEKITRTKKAKKKPDWTPSNRIESF